MMLRAHLHRAAVACIFGLATLPAAADTAPCQPWPAWNAFRTHFINEAGRVIDPSAPPGLTTSEGQAYSMFFALVAGDQDNFARILRWTEDNLADGDLTARLPAWQWGRRPDGSWGVLDENAAADADLWIAYALGEAGRLWNEPRYAALSRLLAERALREETLDLAGLGRTLLPGPSGFVQASGQVRLNPSYAPLQIMRRFATLYPQRAWTQLAATSLEVIVRAAPRGFAPDWVRYRVGAGFQADTETGAAGGFNAIRVYLWAGMLAEDDPARAALLRTLRPAAQAVAMRGTPPLSVATRDGKMTDTGPAGFSAAMLPMLSALRMHDAADAQRLRIEARAPLAQSDNYYDQALVLFGAGFAEGRYHFARDGALVPTWTCAAH